MEECKSKDGIDINENNTSLNSRNEDDVSSNLPGSDLPFLITQWLDQYGSSRVNDKIDNSGNSHANNNNKRAGESLSTTSHEAIETIRRATLELSRAFQDLGAFGSTIDIKSMLFLKEDNHPIQAKSSSKYLPSSTTNSSATHFVNASYNDIRRRVSVLSNGSSSSSLPLLEAIVQSSGSATSTALVSARQNAQSSHTSCLDAAHELQIARSQLHTNSKNINHHNANNYTQPQQQQQQLLQHQQQNTNIDNANTDNHMMHSSILQPPVLFGPTSSIYHSQTKSTLNSLSSSSLTTKTTAVSSLSPSKPLSSSRTIHQEQNKTLHASLQSDPCKIDEMTARASKRLFNLKSKASSLEHEIRNIQKSLAKLKFKGASTSHANSTAAKTLLSTNPLLKNYADARLVKGGEKTRKAEMEGSSHIIYNTDSHIPKTFNTNTNTNTNYNPIADCETERITAQLHRKLDEQLAKQNRAQMEIQVANSVLQAFISERSSPRCNQFIDPHTYLPPNHPLHTHARTNGGGSHHLYLRSVGPHIDKHSSLPARLIAYQHGLPQRVMSSSYSSSAHAINQRCNLTRKSILKHRLSHAITTSCHLSYPVYCLRFDRTGRYFVTGADDHLVKLFRLGRVGAGGMKGRTSTKTFNHNHPYGTSQNATLFSATQSTRNSTNLANGPASNFPTRNNNNNNNGIIMNDTHNIGGRNNFMHESFNGYHGSGNNSSNRPLTTSTTTSMMTSITSMRSSVQQSDIQQDGDALRGAVLVCTLRGHAGVVTDIDISSDNALLATASEDGDVRVWGMADGCPVAVLRGHEGGANMVSWSTLTPYRLVTTGQDGLARVWDVREAALIRCKKTIGSRIDYTHNIKSSNKINQNGLKSDSSFIKNLSISQRIGNKEIENEKEKTLDSKKKNGRHCLVQIDSSSNFPLIPVPLPISSGANQRNSITSGNMLGTGNHSVYIDSSNHVLTRQEINAAIPIIQPNQNGDDGTDNNAVIPGAFVANDSMDEGVILLSKLQHGEIHTNDPSKGHIISGPGTRSKLKKVKVICMARCPIGGHFATGSDDGLGRIWMDEDDLSMEIIDGCRRERNSNFDGVSHTYGGEIQSKMEGIIHLDKYKEGRTTRLNIPRKNGKDLAPSTSTLMYTLTGHHNSITDVSYSHCGDRLLTASQKDGIIKIWFWGTDNAKCRRASNYISNENLNKHTRIQIDQVRQVIIRLTCPANNSSTTNAELNGNRQSQIVSIGTGVRRRRSNLPNSSSPLAVQCDVAIWSSDDKHIISSQSSQINPSAPDIVPGSHMLHIWDSWSGHCLVGITSSHTAACPVLLSHPFESSIVACGGADGILNVWNCESGECIFSHKNTVDYGPVEPPSDRGKASSYLDGNFSPDGLSLVLTDDKGRITVIDYSDLPHDHANSSSVDSTHGENVINTLGYTTDKSCPRQRWMQEQYFANDYYDLFYDSNGYCIEKGSELPPHIAPRGVRCDHSGQPYVDNIQERFSGMVGPNPLPEKDVRIARDIVRKKGLTIRRKGFLQSNLVGMKAISNTQSSSVLHDYPSFFCIGNNYGYHDTTEHNVLHNSINAIHWSNRATNYIRSRTERITSSLNPNYRWSDYDDILREERQQQNGEDERDPDDEEYTAPPTIQNHGTQHSLQDDEDSMFDDSEEDDIIIRRRRRNNNSERVRALGRGRRLRGNRDESDNRSSYQDRQSRIGDSAENLIDTRRSQPTRVSTRRRNEIFSTSGEEENEEESEIEEMLSKNTKPSGEFVNDYTVLGFLFKLPTNVTVSRKIHGRIDCIKGGIGEKTYVPQVGDSVIYIPRAHLEFFKRFPEMNMPKPWTSWPSQSNWSLVRCKVVDSRFRFPHAKYYENKKGSSNTIKSVVQILTLEVTGISTSPTTSSHKLWPRPEFAYKATRSKTSSFEVCLFESDLLDFIIPETLYTWRISSLDEFLRKESKSQDKTLLTYFTPGEGDNGFDEEDANYIPTTCKYEKIKEDVFLSDVRLKGCGYNSIGVKYSSDDSLNFLCSFEVSPLNEKAPLPSCLTAEQRKAFVWILNHVEKDERLKYLFSSPVDTRIYVDYSDLIEVPMDFSMIRKRLENNYYTNVMSVSADVKLIHDNCMKYNDSDTQIADEARKLYTLYCDLFEKKISGICSLVGQREDIEIDSLAHSGWVPNSNVKDYMKRSSSISISSAKNEHGEISEYSEDEEVDGYSSTSIQRTQRKKIDKVDDVNTSSPKHLQGKSSAGKIVSTQKLSKEQNIEEEKNRLSSRYRPRRNKIIENLDDKLDEAVYDESNYNWVDRESSRSDPSMVSRSKANMIAQIKTKDKKKYNVHVSKSRNLRSNSNIKTEILSSSCSDLSSNEGQELDSSPQRITTRANVHRKRKVKEDKTQSSRKKRAKPRTSSDLFDESYTSTDDDDKVSQKSSKRGRQRTLTSLKRTQYMTKSMGSMSSDNDDYSMDASSFEDSSEKGFKTEDESYAEESSPEDSNKNLFPILIHGKCVPQLKPWPRNLVEVKDVTYLCKKILKEVQQMDEENIFFLPVIEQYPCMKDEYLEVIITPMDLFTIKNDRVPFYKDVSDLQDDLITIFSNCCTFNGPDDRFWNYSINIWKQLNNIFKAVLKTEQIQIPKRF